MRRPTTRPNQLRRSAPVSSTRLDSKTGCCRRHSGHSPLRERSPNATRTNVHHRWDGARPEFAALREAAQLNDLLLQAREARICCVVCTQFLPSPTDAQALRHALLSAGYCSATNAARRIRKPLPASSAPVAPSTSLTRRTTRPALRRRASCGTSMSTASTQTNCAISPAAWPPFASNQETGASL